MRNTRRIAPKCAQELRRPMSDLANLIRSSQKITPEIQAAIVETDRLRSECRDENARAFLSHSR